MWGFINDTNSGSYMPLEKFTVLRTGNTAFPEKGIYSNDVDNVYDTYRRFLLNRSPAEQKTGLKNGFRY